MTTPGEIRDFSCPRPNIGPNASYSDWALPGSPSCMEREMAMNPCLKIEQRPILPPYQYYLKYWEPVAFRTEGQCIPNPHYPPQY